MHSLVGWLIDRLLGIAAAGLRQQEASSALASAEPVAAKLAAPESPAGLFVAQSPRDNREQAKTHWVAHRIQTLGYTAQQADAGEFHKLVLWYH